MIEHPIILGRYVDWSYSVRSALVSDIVTWDRLNETTHHIWGHDDSPTHIIGVCHFKIPISQPKIIKAIESLFVDGVIKVEALTTVKEITRAIRHVKELSHLYEAHQKSHNGN